MIRPLAKTSALAFGACSLLSLSSASVSFNGTPGREIPPSTAMGMTVAWPAGYLERKPAGATSLKLRGPGRVPGNNMPASAFNKPGHRIVDMFPDQIGIELDAMSTGNAVFPSVNLIEGWIEPNFVNWLFVTASVKKNSRGFPGSLIDGAFQANEEANTLFSHYLDESVFLDPFLVGATVVEAPASRIGRGPNSQQDLVGLDFALGVLTYNTQVDSSITFPNGLGEFYFSVTPGWAFSPAGINFAVDDNSNPVNAHPGTIYKISWLGQGLGWGQPVVFIDESELRSGESAVDVDALDIDTSTDTVLFSATSESNLASQIMLKQKGGPPPVPAEDGHGVPIGERLRVDDAVDTELDALCGTDPEGSALGNSVAYQGGADTTISTLGLLADGESGGLSVTRVGTGPGVPTPGFYMVLSGWGSHAPAAGVCYLDVQTGTITASTNEIVTQKDVITYYDFARDRAANDELLEFFIPFAAPTTPPVSNGLQPFFEAQFSTVVLPVALPLDVRRSPKVMLLDF